MSGSSARQIILLAVDVATLNAYSVLASSIALLTLSKDSSDNGIWKHLDLLLSHSWQNLKIFLVSFIVVLHLICMLLTYLYNFHFWKMPSFSSLRWHSYQYLWMALTISLSFWLWEQGPGEEAVEKSNHSAFSFPCSTRCSIAYNWKAVKQRINQIGSNEGQSFHSVYILLGFLKMLHAYLLDLVNVLESLSKYKKRRNLIQMFYTAPFSLWRAQQWL